MNSEDYNQIVDGLKKPIAQEALSELYKGSNLSAINADYVYERLNDVFGIDGWIYTADIIKEIPKGEKLYVVARVTLRCKISQDRFVERTQYGGNMNPKDVGDSYKGAITDALTKCASMIYIAGDVYKGKQSHRSGAGAGVLKQQLTSTNDSKSPSQNPAPHQSKKSLSEWKETVGFVGWMKNKGTKYGELTSDEIDKQITYWKGRDLDEKSSKHLEICNKLKEISEKGEKVTHISSTDFQIPS